MYMLVFILAVTTTVQGLGRIVGGKNAEIRDHNYQVSVEYGGKHWYGGVLITPNVVITEATFLETKKPYLTVRAGSSIVHKGGKVLNVLDLHLHPKFHGPASQDYDVAILVLDGSFPLNQDIGLIKLAPKGLINSKGTVATITGWGGTKENEYFTEHLQYLQIPYVAWNDCKTYITYLTKRMSCWGFLHGKNDICSGDAGGPLVIQDNTGNVLLAGVVSFDFWCGGDYDFGYPRSYSDITNEEIHDFISKFL